MPETPWRVPYRIAIVGFVLTCDPIEQASARVSPRIQQIHAAAESLGWDAASPCVIRPIRVLDAYLRRLLVAHGLPTSTPDGSITVGEIGVASADAPAPDLEAAAHIVALWFSYVRQSTANRWPRTSRVRDGNTN